MNVCTLFSIDHGERCLRNEWMFYWNPAQDVLLGWYDRVRVHTDVTVHLDEDITIEWDPFHPWEFRRHKSMSLVRPPIRHDADFDPWHRKINSKNRAYFSMSFRCHANQNRAFQHQPRQQHIITQKQFRLLQFIITTPTIHHHHHRLAAQIQAHNKSDTVGDPS